MTEREFEDALRTLIEEIGNVNTDEEITASDLGIDETNFAGARISSFSESGVLTNNRGLVIRLQDGSEFQITIVRSDEGEIDEEEE